MTRGDILEKYIIPNDKLISWREIDGEVVFLHLNEKAFYELNKTGNFIWKEAVGKQKIKEIIKAVQTKYGKVNKEILRKDALDFINNLLKKKTFLLKNEF